MTCPHCQAPLPPGSRFCPACGGGLGIATEFWEAEARRFYCSCTGCGWTGEITPTGAVAMGHEPAH